MIVAWHEVPGTARPIIPCPTGRFLFSTLSLALRARLWSLHIFARGTNVKLEVDAWIAAQRLNRLAQALQPWVEVKSDSPGKRRPMVRYVVWQLVPGQTGGGS
jgi:hypothetical protein